MKINFSCPVCKGVLTDDGRTYRCEKNHCFDKAKQGYVNLLQSQKSSKKRHGDDALMVKARQDFLEKGFYNDLCRNLINVVVKFATDEVTLIDLGCGECWYTAQLFERLSENCNNPSVFGIDISKQALIAGSKRCKNLKLAVASTADIPMPDESCDIAVCVFAPYSDDDVRRILKRGGVFIKAFPLENHLMGLKSAIYEKPYKNEVTEETPAGFEKIDFIHTDNTIALDTNEDILNLFRMTPYYYNTSQSDRQKLEKYDSLKTKVEFLITEYKKNSDVK